MTITHVKPGDRWQPSATLHNVVVDMYHAVASGDLAQPGGFGGGSQRRSEILVKNESGQDVPVGGVLAVDGPVFGPGDNLSEFTSNLALRGVLPDLELHLGRFVIAAEPIGNGAVGRAVDGGTTVCRIIAEDQDHYADIDDGQTGYLRGGPEGSAVILWLEPGQAESERWALVRIASPAAPSSNVFLAQIGAALPEKYHDLFQGKSFPYAWRYHWREVQWHPSTNSYQPKEHSQWPMVHAWNANELTEPENLENKIANPGLDCQDPSDIPLSSKLKRLQVPPGHIVLMMATRDIDGHWHYSFAAPNPLLGCCLD